MIFGNLEREIEKNFGLEEVIIVPSGNADPVYEPNENLANETFKFKPDMNIRFGCYCILGNIAFLRKEMKEMAHYMNLYTACSDAIKKVESQTKVAVLEKMHQDSKDIQSGKRNSIVFATLLSNNSSLISSEKFVSNNLVSNL